jgi:AraC-like DNA-binding protein
MTEGHSVPNVDWLLREAMDERTLKTGERMVIDDASWRADIERLEIGAGLRVFLTDAEAWRDVTIEARDDRTDRWMGSQVTVAGRADIDFLDGQKTHAAANQALLFRPSGRRAAYSLKAGGKFHSAGYGLEVERIRRLFEDDVPAALRPLLEPDVAVSRIVAMRGERPMRNLAAGLFARGLNGPLRTLMIEGAVLQLLAAQAAALARRPASPPRRVFSARERDAIGEARERLFADMRRPPTLGELAAATGLTEKRLNAGFRAVFGATVFECLRNERLEHARIALEEGASLKDVASRVGYNHVNNFIRAFAARYGAPPARYGGAAPDPRTARLDPE